MIDIQSMMMKRKNNDDDDDYDYANDDWPLNKYDQLYHIEIDILFIYK